MRTCDECGREVERGNLIHGVYLCASCAMTAEMPKPKHLSEDWRDFTTQKRRRRTWR